jgi:hypothetical protein
MKANKIVILLIIFSGQLSKISAQTLIPKIGLSYSKTTWDASASGTLDYRQGSFFGLGIEFPVIKNHFNMLLEGQYVGKGQHYSSIHESATRTTKDDYTTANNYFVFNALLKKYYDIDPIRYYIAGGPFLGVGLGGTFKGYYTYFDRTVGYVTDYRNYDGEVLYGEFPLNYNGDNYYIKNRFDYGINLSAGIVFFKWVLVDFSYQRSLGKAQTIDSYGQNRSIIVSVGVPIKLK